MTHSFIAKIVISNLLVVVVSTQLYSQQHDNNWLFGYQPNIPEEYFGGSMLDFSTEPPIISYFDIPIDFSAIAMISNTTGELLAYSNGCVIVDKNHEIPLDGNGINSGYIHDIYCTDGGYPITQGLIFLPSDTSSQDYKLIHLWIGQSFLVSALRSTNIHVDLDGKLTILKKNTLVDSTVLTEDITAVKHANGRDWWIIMPLHESNEYVRYLSTPYEISRIGTQVVGEKWDRRDWSGQITFSPDGTKLVRVNPYNGIHIFSFDRCSGLLSDPLITKFQNDSISACGAAFSLDSRFLYISASLWLYQFDMLAADIIESKVVVGRYDNFIADHGLGTPFFQQMLAPNGKVYISAPNSVRYLHVIHDPSVKGIACNLEQHGVTLPALHAFSIPNFPNYRLGPVDGSTCDTLGIDNHPISKWRHEFIDTNSYGIRFIDLSYFEPEVWEWDFGDGDISNIQQPVHYYTAPGHYRVCLRVSNEYGTDSSYQWIEIETVAVEEEISNHVFEIFPNPFKDYVEFHPPSGYQDVHVRLFTVSGHQVLNQRLTCPCRLRLDNLPSGLYFYSLYDNTLDKPIDHGRLVKVK